LDIGLDSVGIMSAAHLLKRIAKEDEVSAFIISHKSEIENMFDSTVTIQLSKGFSYIKEG
jgi:ABC-type multidrug transport system ATPase subunit